MTLVSRGLKRPAQSTSICNLTLHATDYNTQPAIKQYGLVYIIILMCNIIKMSLKLTYPHKQRDS